MNNKILIGVGIAGLLAFLLLRKKASAKTASSAPAPSPVSSPSPVASQPEQVFVGEKPLTTEPSRPIEQVMEQKRQIALQAEEVPAPVAESPVAEVPIVFGGSSFSDLGFSERMQVVQAKDFGFYSDQLVTVTQPTDIFR